MTTPRHPRRDTLAEAAYQALVVARAARERMHVTRWHNLIEPDREKWRQQADEWAYVLAMDAREEVARRKAAEQQTVTTPATWRQAPLPTPAYMDEPFSGVYRTSGFVDRTFVDTFRDSDAARGARWPGDVRHFPVPHYVIHPDGRVSKVMVKPGGRPPAPVRELEQGHPTDTRRTTHHAMDLDPTATGILRRNLYAYALTTYPLAGNGLPAGEVECGCTIPAPMRHYGDQSPLHPDHRPPGDAWLRCVACRGLYTRDAR